MWRAVTTVGASLAVALCAAAPAGADDTAIVVTGAAHDRDVVAAAAARGATADPGNGVVALAAKDSAALLRCVTAPARWTCVTTALRGKPVQRLAALAIEPLPADDGARRLAVSAQVFAAAASASDKRTCERCTDDALGKLAGELTRDVLRDLATREGRTTLSIKSVPAGARITLDAKPVGATDTVLSSYPGSHDLTLELDGYQLARRRVDTPVDRTTEVAVALTAVAPVVHAPPVTPATRSKLLPWITVAVGGAALVTGAILIAVDGVPSSDPRVVQSRYYYSTKGPGIATAIAGAACAGAGLYWAGVF